MQNTKMQKAIGYCAGSILFAVTLFTIADLYHVQNAHAALVGDSKVVRSNISEDGMVQKYTDTFTDLLGTTKTVTCYVSGGSISCL